MRSELFKMLHKGALEGIEFDPGVLNRMERLAGLEPAGGEEDRGWNRRVQTASNRPASQEEG